MKPKHIYRIFFTSQGKSYEVYARKVSQGDLYGFIEIEEIVFGEKSTMVIDPSEEALKKEFASVRRLHIPYHQISRIDEVEKEGTGKVITLAGGGEASASPASLIPPAKGPGRQ